MKKYFLALGIIVLLMPALAALGEEPETTAVIGDDPQEVTLEPTQLTRTPWSPKTKTPWVPPTPSPTEPVPTEIMITTTPSHTPTETITPTETPPGPTEITITPTSTATATRNPPDFDVCEVNLVENSHTCRKVPAVRMIVPPSGGQAVIEIDLIPFPFGHKRVAFELHYSEFPAWGMTLNVGDSITNNGFGGDGASQSNDAELQVSGGQLQVYGNDGTPNDVRQMLKLDRFLTSGNVNLIEVSDQSLVWGTNGEKGTLRSEHLFALNGQPDSEGPVNYKIYAGFNRSIAGSYRSGHGLELVVIFLLH